MGTGRTADEGGKRFHEVLGTLVSRIAEGDYPVGSFLPPQRELAQQLGVSRDTVQRVLRQLADEMWIESRQGSGSRVLRSQTVQSSTRRNGAAKAVSLRPLFDAAFEKSEVALDVFTLTSETLDTYVRMQKDRIWAQEIKPRSIKIRMMLPSGDVRLPYPFAKHAPDDPRPRERLKVITERHTTSLRDTLREIDTNKSELTAKVDIRHVPLVPYSKIYLFNRAEAVTGPYEPVEHRTAFDDGDVVDVVDVMGVGSTLTHFAKDDDPLSQESVLVNGWQSWFESTWNRLAK